MMISDSGLLSWATLYIIWKNYCFYINLLQYIIQFSKLVMICSVIQWNSLCCATVLM